MPLDTNTLLAIAVIGLVIGFVTNFIMGSGGMGLLWTIVLGLIGSFIGNYLFHVFGIVTDGLLRQILAGVIGACLLIFIIRKLRQA